MQRKAVGIALGLAALAGGWLAIGPDWRAVLAHPPLGRDVLFWSLAQRDAGFRMLDRVPVLAASHLVRAGPDVRPMPVGPPLALDVDLEAFLAHQRSAALIVVHDGQTRLERYGLGFGPTGRWTSFSVAKSVTSTLVGAAIADGAIDGVDDPVTRHLPELAGSAYDGVTLAQLLTMTSGVAWNEDYEDPRSDVARYDAHVPEPGMDATVSYLRTLPRAHPPGTVWNYSTGETNLIGVLLARATGRPLADLLSEKIWRPYGMERDASWLLASTGQEMSGCCLQAATRDFARFGQFVLDGGVVRGVRVLPAGWLERATRRQADIGAPGAGYGFQWWTFDDGSFQADGIFGQGIFIDPKRRLVIASNASWRSAEGETNGEWDERHAFHRAVQRALDREAGAPAP